MSASSAPLVAVLPDRHEPGIDKHSDLESKRRNRPRVYRARPLHSVITERYSTYAHLLLYQVEGNKSWPRINKPALTETRELGLKVTVSITCLDYDNADHAPWKDKKGYKALLRKLKRTPGLILPTYVWRTRAGARLLFSHPPVSPEQAEALHEWLRTHYMSHGIPLDPKVWEWARPHALPWVVRDDVPLDPEPVLQFEPLTILPDLPERRVRLKVDSETLRADIPDADEATALVWKNGSDKLTDWGTWAKRRMAGSDAEAAFDLNTLPQLEVKLRNPTLFKWAGALAHCTFGKKRTTPQHVFGLLYPTIHANHRDGLAKEIWRGVCYCWAEEEAKSVAAEEEAKTFLEGLRQSMKVWSPDAPDSEEEFNQWVRSRMVLSHGTDYYLLQPNGLYAPSPVKHASLVAGLRTGGMVGTGRVLPDLVTKDGTAVKCQDVVDRFSTPISSIVITGGQKIGGVLKDSPTGPELVLTTFSRREDIKIAPSEWCAGWLRAMWGEHLPTAEEWISCSLHFEGGPVAALSTVAGGGVGKDLFMWALALATSSKTFSLAKQVVGEFKPKIHRTPWVWFNEGVPRIRELHTIFRELVGGHVLESNRKHIQQQDVNMCARVFMSANKPIIMEALFGDPHMSDVEQEATAERVIHIPLGTGGRKWLEAHGSKDVAAEKLNSGELSGHFLWLWETIPRSRHTGRFQMTGDRANPYLRSLAFVAVATVGEILVRMFEAGKLSPLDKVKAGKVLDFSDNLLLTSRARDLSLVSVGRALARFVRPDRRPNLRKLWEFATACGMDAPVLRQAIVRIKKAKAKEG